MIDTHNSNPQDWKRRAFLKSSAVALGAGGFAVLAPASGDAAEDRTAGTSPSLIARDNVILFQGDSITDWGRSRERAGVPNDPAALGSGQGDLGPGYAWLAAVELLTDRPQDGLKIFNRGISGNKVFQLADRWQADCLDLKPDVLSVLIGVNDYWHTLTSGYHGTVEIYEKDYRALTERTLKALPAVKLIICEPFALHYGSVDETWTSGFAPYRAAAKRVAEACRATFIPFQTRFDEAIKYAPPQHWSKDGVHPAVAGSALMAYAWAKAVNGSA
jgi:lysophospholipase L1-like esterase